MYFFVGRQSDWTEIWRSSDFYHWSGWSPCPRLSQEALHWLLWTGSRPAPFALRIYLCNVPLPTKRYHRGGQTARDAFAGHKRLIGIWKGLVRNIRNAAIIDNDGMTDVKHAGYWVVMTLFVQDLQCLHASGWAVTHILPSQLPDCLDLTGHLQKCWETDCLCSVVAALVASIVWRFVWLHYAPWPKFWISLVHTIYPSFRSAAPSITFCSSRCCSEVRLLGGCDPLTLRSRSSSFACNWVSCMPCLAKAASRLSSLYGSSPKTLLRAVDSAHCWTAFRPSTFVLVYGCSQIWFCGCSKHVWINWISGL